MLMSQLFWQQSQNWQSLALAHIDRIDALCAAFVRSAIDAVTPETISERLQVMKLTKALEHRRQAAVQELAWLISDKQRPPITYDPSYTATVQESRARKTTAKSQSLMEQAKVDVS